MNLKIIYLIFWHQIPVIFQQIFQRRTSWLWINIGEHICSSVHWTWTSRKGLHNIINNYSCLLLLLLRAKPKQIPPRNIVLPPLLLPLQIRCYIWHHFWNSPQIHDNRNQPLDKHHPVSCRLWSAATVYYMTCKRRIYMEENFPKYSNQKNLTCFTIGEKFPMASIMRCEDKIFASDSSTTY